MINLNIVAGLITWSCVCAGIGVVSMLLHFNSNFRYEEKLIKAGRHMVPTMNMLNFMRNFVFQIGIHCKSILVSQCMCYINGY